MRVGRNEPCPCGSGKKYKVCCEGKQSRGASPGLIALLVAIGIVAALGVVASMRQDDKPASVPAPTAASNTPRKQPPGPVPAGKVWSEEHGHWHDAKPAAGQSPIRISPTATVPGTTPGATPNARVPFTPKPQPPGPAPAGKVWSPEHGHWHDAKTP